MHGAVDDHFHKNFRIPSENAGDVYGICRNNGISSAKVFVIIYTANKYVYLTLLCRVRTYIWVSKYSSYSFITFFLISTSFST